MEADNNHSHDDGHDLRQSSGCKAEPWWLGCATIMATEVQCCTDGCGLDDTVMAVVRCIDALKWFCTKPVTAEVATTIVRA